MRNLFDEMNIVLNSLHEGARIIDVPKEKRVTKESLQNLRSKLEFAIKENNNKQYLSLKKAKDSKCL